MPRLAFKPDASFFRKIAIGAVGTRAICANLRQYGHEICELERGSTDTKLWKEVKRKRFRIPDLVCTRCGTRIESRAKTKPELSMSHSPTDQARTWDFGMVDTDWVAFPVCEPVDEEYWSAGRLGADVSYWHERNWVRWQARSWINYFTVHAFRAAAHSRAVTKGVTEGSETAIFWDAMFATSAGTVESLQSSTTIPGLEEGPGAVRSITVRRSADGRRQTRRIPGVLHITVAAGDGIHTGQLLASTIQPLGETDLSCLGMLPPDHIAHLLASRERTQRFTGVKLARLRQETSFQGTIGELTHDAEEDVYTRLEGASYLAAVCGVPPRELFASYLASTDQQTQLEAVIALGETGTPNAVELLTELLDQRDQPYFLRSAAAWSLGRVGDERAVRRLVRAFTDVDLDLRSEALEGIISVGGLAAPVLFAGLLETDGAIAAGCAEALRQQQSLPDAMLMRLVEELRSECPSPWAVWLAGNLPREHVATAIADLQETRPELHYAVSLLWSFVESWIARRWELAPLAVFPTGEAQGAV